MSNAVHVSTVVLFQSKLQTMRYFISNGCVHHDTSSLTAQGAITFYISFCSNILYKLQFETSLLSSSSPARNLLEVLLDSFWQG